MPAVRRVRAVPRNRPMIELYQFGLVVIDGRQYTSDVLIYPDGRIDPSWWRKEGHRLALEDIQPLIDQAPEVMLAGTGASGLMRIDAELRDFLAGSGIEFIAAPTKQAVSLYNERLLRKQKVAACLHLTC